MNQEIRPCGGGWEYCDGNCDGCNKNHIEYSNTTNNDM